MDQTYCRPVAGVEILASHDGEPYQLATIQTAGGICVVDQTVLVHLRGEQVLHTWFSCGQRKLKVAGGVSGLEDDELLIDENGMVYAVADIKEE